MNLARPEDEQPKLRDNRDGVLPATEEHCLNCEAQLTGPFCAQCGQRGGPPVLSSREWVRQAVDDLVSLDYKLPRTLWRLISSPGLVTREYLDGRRERFTRPIRIYIVVSAVSIAAMTTLGLMDLSNLLGSASQEDLEVFEAMFDIEDASNPVFRERFNRRVNTSLSNSQSLQPLGLRDRTQAPLLASPHTGAPGLQLPLRERDGRRLYTSGHPHAPAAAHRGHRRPLDRLRGLPRSSATTRVQHSRTRSRGADRRTGARSVDRSRSCSQRPRSSSFSEPSEAAHRLRQLQLRS